MWTGGQVPLRMVNVTWTDLDSPAFILHLCKNFWIASRLVCSVCEALSGSVSIDSDAVSSAKAAVVPM
jgi:hypothetical protein